MPLIICPIIFNDIRPIPLLIGIPSEKLGVESTFKILEAKKNLKIK
jgi:hypothetical protein